MSQLRAPAARADRREGGRHGRPGARPHTPQPMPDVHIRPQLLRAAVLPAVVVALSGAAAVLFTLRATAAEPQRDLWVALAAAAALVVVSLAAAVVGAERAARTVLDRCNALRGAGARAQAELRTVVEQLRRGEGPPVRRTPPPAPRGGDAFDRLEQEMARAHEAALGAVVQAAQLSNSAGADQMVEVFVNLARRLQSLVHREIQLLDELENDVEDPELLKGLFHVDHLATRIRRHAENLAVLGGAVSRRQWSNPVTMTEVLRSSIAEVEQYSRVKLVPPIDGTLRGHAVADVIHLLAELVENATVFSAPHTTVLLRAQHVTSGLAIEVEDRGLGMPLAEQNKMNALLHNPDNVNVGRLLQDGRIGLFVVSALARRHGITVRLQANIYGGVQAVLVLPQQLLGGDDQVGPGRAATAATGQPGPPPAPAGNVPPHATASGPAYPAPTGPGTGPSTAGSVPTPAAPTPAAPAPALNGHSHAPLPVRDAREDRPTPAAARPGAGLSPRPDFSAEPVHTQAQPRSSGYVRGITSRPSLPRRRSQENLVPQLREAPAVPRDDEYPALHDPGLMAAFQRGIGLAEAQPDPHPDPHPEPHAAPDRQLAPYAEQHAPYSVPHPDRAPDPHPAPRLDQAADGYAAPRLDQAPDDYPAPLVDQTPDSYLVPHQHPAPDPYPAPHLEQVPDPYPAPHLEQVPSPVADPARGSATAPAPEQHPMPYHPREGDAG
ncbi:sensor histidine kinase [Streptomyces agglomeratus]|uniref:sensor histidine kinase n=1 Tax=Streptomyces agglomeratus TaxID=285458 RepID=UPI00099F507F|nr:ATP-binding protein [Streptomyces agglomeratus]